MNGNACVVKVLPVRGPDKDGAVASPLESSVGRPGNPVLASVNRKISGNDGIFGCMLTTNSAMSGDIAKCHHSQRRR